MDQGSVFSGHPTVYTVLEKSQNASFQIRSLQNKIDLWGGGYSWEFLVGVCHPFSNPDPTSDQKLLFSPPIFRSGLLNPYLVSDLLHRQKNEGFFESIMNWHSTLSFYIHLELKRQICSYTTTVSLKTIPDSRPKWAKSISVFRMKRPKLHTFWGGTYL